MSVGRMIATVLCVAACVVVGYLWRPLADSERAGDGAPPGVGAAPPPAPAPAAVARPDPVVERRRGELRALEEFHRRAEAASVGGDAVDVGEFLDPELRGPGSARITGPLDVGEYMVPEERP